MQRTHRICNSMKALNPLSRSAKGGPASSKKAITGAGVEIKVDRRCTLSSVAARCSSSREAALRRRIYR